MSNEDKNVGAVVEGVIIERKNYGIFIETDLGQVLVKVADISHDKSIRAEEYKGIGAHVQVRIKKFISGDNSYLGSMIGLGSD